MTQVEDVQEVISMHVNMLKKREQNLFKRTKFHDKT